MSGREKRAEFEDKIKRSYFHIKPLDLKQLKNWEAYLDFEIADGDHQRIVVLFERCLVVCALYEQFWAKYARYLEKYHSAGAVRERRAKESDEERERRAPSKQSNSVARWAFGTGLTKVDEIREKRCTWTLRGWKEKDEDGKEVVTKHKAFLQQLE